MKIGMTLENTIGLMLPAIIFFASAIIMLIFYKITDADAAKYAKENMEKIKQQTASVQNTQE